MLVCPAPRPGIPRKRPAVMVRARAPLGVNVRAGPAGRASFGLALLPRVMIFAPPFCGVTTFGATFAGLPARVGALRRGGALCCCTLRVGGRCCTFACGGARCCTLACGGARCCTFAREAGFPAGFPAGFFESFCWADNSIVSALAPCATLL